jgi:hypothetical protein
MSLLLDHFFIYFYYFITEVFFRKNEFLFRSAKKKKFVNSKSIGDGTRSKNSNERPDDMRRIHSKILTEKR